MHLGVYVRLYMYTLLLESHGKISSKTKVRAKLERLAQVLGSST